MFPRPDQPGLSRRRMLGALGAGAGALAFGPLLAACGGGSGAITQWNGWTGARGIEAQKQLAAEFNRLGGGLRVEQTGYPWDTLFTKLPAASQAGNPPDVVVVHPTEVPQFVELGLLRPLDDLVRQAGIDLSGLAPETVEACSYGGQLYAVPGDVHPQALWYNTDLVQRAGLDPAAPPRTGAEFLEWVRALTVTDGGETSQYGFQLAYRGEAGARWLFWTLLHQFGGTFFDEGTTRCTVDGDAGRSALQFVVDLVGGGGVATGGTQQDPVAAGQVAMWVTGSWEIALRAASDLPFETAEMPLFGSQPAVWANSHCLALTARQSDEHAAEAMRYVKFFFDNYAIPASTVGFIPLNPQARRDERLTGLPHFRHYEPFIDSLSYTVLEPAVLQYTDLFSFGKPTPVNTNIEAAIDGTKSVAAALADMQNGTNEVLRG